MIDMYPGMINSPTTELSSSITNSQTTISVNDASKLPDAPNLATIYTPGEEENAETIKYEGKSGNDLTSVTRGLQGTAKAWDAGTRVSRLFTAYDYDALRQNVETLDSDKADATDLSSHLADYASKRFGDRPYTGRDDADITYYIDAVNGDDSNDGLSSVTAFKTWGKVHSVIPRFGGYSGITIRIIGNLNEIIRLENVIAYGQAAHRIYIVGDTEDADNHSVNGIELHSLVGGQHYSIMVSHLTVNGPCKLYGCTGVHIGNCKPRNNNGPGVDLIGSTALIINCDFGTDIVQDCISALYSLVASDNNTGNGTRNGLRATNAATIGKFGTQPTGTTANEFANVGGEIL